MRLLLAAALALSATAASAQMPKTPPGAPDAARVKAGTYTVDPQHTQVVFTVNHLGFNSYWGIFGDATGSLTLDPARPNAASVTIEVPIAKVTTTSEKLNAHLQTPDFFDAAKYPTAMFKSTSVAVSGKTARITGNLTLHGVTKPVVLDAKFTGAGKSMMGGGDTIGFEATTSIKRSDFGVSGYVPLITDVVPLKITAAFEKK